MVAPTCLQLEITIQPKVIFVLYISKLIFVNNNRFQPLQRNKPPPPLLLASPAVAVAVRATAVAVAAAVAAVATAAAVAAAARQFWNQL